MSKTLNFNTIKKQFLTVTFADEKKTTIFVGTPTKKIMDDIILLQASIETLNTDNTNETAINDIYSACAKIMSRNKAGVKISVEYLEEVFDFEDIIVFFNAYIDFVTELANEKN